MSTINESKAVMDKLDSLMSAAKEFGNQSEQLEKAKGSFAEYVAEVSKTDQKLKAVISKCDEYIESVQGLLNTDFSAPIKEIADRAEQSITACREQCQEVTADFTEALNAFEQRRPAFEEKTASMLQEISDSVDQVREELSTTVLETVEQSRDELVKVKQEAASMQAKLDAMKAELEAEKVWRVKNEVMIKVGAIVAGLAAVASIINLFI